MNTSEQEIKNKVMKLQLSNGYYLRFEHLSHLLHYVLSEISGDLSND